MFADQALNKLLQQDFNTVLDVGSGEGIQAKIMQDAGKEVTTIAWTGDADYIGDYCDTEFPHGFDAIWASHVLEHQRNTGLFLDKCFRDISEGGWLAVTVPPLKQDIVGGHVNLYNAGLLLYQLILAGFDCKNAMVKTYGYNISVIVKKKKAVLPDLWYDRGDIELLSPFFPMQVKQGFNGHIASVNWQ